MSMTHRSIKAKLRKLNLITENGQPLLYSQFKNLATVKEYGKKNSNFKKSIVFTGLPKEALFGYYINHASYSEMLLEAYDLYKRLVYGDMGPIFDKTIVIGNTGIPEKYEKLEWVNS